MRAKTQASGNIKGASAAAECQVLLRITVLRPPAGVQLCLQSGKADLVSPTVPAGEDVSFDLAVRVKDPGGKGLPPRFLGPFTQGPPEARFVYVCVGTLAGQASSCWTRRAKVPLAGLTWPLVREAMKHPAARLEARYHGTLADGSPSCATVDLPGGWRVVR